jgi:hypothetical protein
MRPIKTMNPPPDKLERLLATLDKLRAEHESRETQERKAREDKKLKAARPWWQNENR